MFRDLVDWNPMGAADLHLRRGPGNGIARIDKRQVLAALEEGLNLGHSEARGILGHRFSIEPSSAATVGGAYHALLNAWIDVRLQSRASLQSALQEPL
jgi:hypothetical protein